MKRQPSEAQPSEKASRRVGAPFLQAGPARQLSHLEKDQVNTERQLWDETMSNMDNRLLPARVENSFDPDKQRCCSTSAHCWASSFHCYEASPRACGVLAVCLQTVTAGVAMIAVYFDAWLAMMAPDDGSRQSAMSWSDTDRLLVRTRWAVAHSNRCGFWSICFGGSASLLPTSNAFHSTANDPYCSRKVAVFYRSELYGHDHSAAVWGAQCLAIAFILSSIVGACVSGVVIAADSGYSREWLSLLRTDFRRAGTLTAVTQVVSGYAAMGLVISVVKRVEEDEYLAMGIERNVGGVSFWMWLAALVVMAVHIFTLGLTPSRRKAVQDHRGASAEHASSIR